MGDAAEIVNARVTVTGRVRPLELAENDSKRSSRKPRPKAHRRVALYDDEIAVFDRDDLEYGMTIRQPCIIEEVDATLFVPKGCVARIDQYGNVLVQLLKEKRAKERVGNYES